MLLNLGSLCLHHPDLAGLCLLSVFFFLVSCHVILTPRGGVVQSLICVRLFAISWTAAHQACLSFTIYQTLLKFMSIESMMLSNHHIPCCPLLLLSSTFPASGSFPVSQLFESGGQSIGALASASVLPVNIQS